MALIVVNREYAREFNEWFLPVEIGESGLTGHVNFGGRCRGDGVVMVSLGVGVLFLPRISFHL